MEDKTIIERDIAAVRNEIREEKTQLSQDPVGVSNPAILAQLGADERVLRVLEGKEERTKEHEHEHGFGY